MMVCVIADDITGAAEMAGIAHRLGLSVSLSLDGRSGGDCDVAVVATDTRSMTEAEAVAETHRVVYTMTADSRIKAFFKKTDSALRGHVVAELAAMVDVLGLKGALYLPANPSKGRIISGGQYLIDGVPIDETPFSFDPEFPAFSSLLAERFSGAAACHICFADACNGEDIEAAVEGAMQERLLLAGAADLFTAFIRRYFNPSASKSPKSTGVGEGSCIIVCGSTQSDPWQCGVEPSFMPTDIYDGVASADGWIAALVGEYRRNPHRVLIAVKDRHLTGREVAVRLRCTMARVVGKLVESYVPENMIIEGGATAYSILSALGWDSFMILDEVAPGVISMLSVKSGSVVTMKPGSYPWGGLFGTI